MSTQIQELCETVLMLLLSATPTLSAVVKHDDAAARVAKNMISVKAGDPEPQLDGPRGYRVEVEITIKSATAAANAATHGDALARLADRTALITAAVAAGMTTGDDLYLLDEEIAGDREETKNLRKRTITVPMIIRKS